MPPKKKKDDEKTQRCTWSDSDDAILVATLRKAKEDGFQADSGWKPQTWARCVEALKDSPGPTKTAEKCQDHWGKSLKNSYNLVSAIRHASGFGWDDGLKIPTAASDVWDAYITKHPKAARWRRTPFPLYDEILYLVDGVVATGAGAFHPGAQTQTQTDLDFESQSGASGDLDATTQDPATPRRSPRHSHGQDRDNDDGISQALGHDDLLGSSPVRPSRGKKRAASSSPAITASKKTKKRNAQAASEVALALERVAASLNVVGSPEVCQKAIHMMEDDGEFSENDEVSIMELFSKNKSVAQTYIASRKKSSRTAFLRRLLADE